MQRISSPKWDMKPGHQYVQKFQDLVASAKRLDNFPGEDLNPAKDEVTLSGPGGTANIRLGRDAAAVEIVAQRSAAHDLGVVDEQQLKTEMLQIEDTLRIHESSESQRLDVSSRMVPGGEESEPRQVGEGHWGRSFDVDMTSGAIISSDPNLNGWFQ